MEAQASAAGLPRPPAVQAPGTELRPERVSQKSVPAARTRCWHRLQRKQRSLCCPQISDTGKRSVTAGGGGQRRLQGRGAVGGARGRRGLPGAAGSPCARDLDRPHVARAGGGRPRGRPCAQDLGQPTAPVGPRRPPLWGPEGPLVACERGRALLPPGSPATHLLPFQELLLGFTSQRDPEGPGSQVPGSPCRGDVCQQAAAPPPRPELRTSAPAPRLQATCPAATCPPPLACGSPPGHAVTHAELAH